MNFSRKISKSLNSAVIANLNAIARRLSSWCDGGCLKKTNDVAEASGCYFSRIARPSNPSEPPSNIIKVYDPAKFWLFPRDLSNCVLVLGLEQRSRHRRHLRSQAWGGFRSTCSGTHRDPRLASGGPSIDQTMASTRGQLALFER